MVALGDAGGAVGGNAGMVAILCSIGAALARITGVVIVSTTGEQLEIRTSHGSKDGNRIPRILMH